MSSTIMQINISTSEKNKQVVQDLTRRLNLRTENVISRIAFAYSLSKNAKLDLKDIQDSKGKEYKEDILFGKYKEYYVAVVCQFYGLYKTDTSISKYIKMHIDHGLELMFKLFENNRNFSSLDFLIENIEKGIENLEDIEVPSGHVINNNQFISKDHFAAPIKIHVGNSLTNNDPIYLGLNNISTYNNCHIAVAGNSGTGKTQFALELLSQFVTITGDKVNFIYLDFKGLKKEDVNYYKPFFTKTKSTLIDAPQTPFPVNPLTFIDNINEKNRILGINKFVDIIISQAKGMGSVQKTALKDAVKEAFLNKRNGEYPSLKDIYEILLNTYTKRDTLTEILESLSEMEIFESRDDSKNSFLNRNYYFSLSGDLSNSVRFTSVFLVINYIYNTFMNMDNAPVIDGNQSIRYVLLIDEAHVIFKEKKSQDLLEKILREVRSKGVSVVLLSQGIEEFNQPSFDFSTMCEIAFLLDIKDKTNSRLINKFLGFTEKDGLRVARNMEKIQKGQAISNVKEFIKGELFKLNQFKDN
jgi:DNA sulfur modification protein DndE